MSKQSWRAGVCVLLTDSVWKCLCMCWYECALYASCDLCLLAAVAAATAAAAAAAAGPRLFETPSTVKRSTVESNRALLK